ncbi:MAG: hypothetical protein MZV64_17870 [Ignavibacteriales bacterium]|nr:hypothetical protein [Ignavibacteriales bacterium]
MYNAFPLVHCAGGFVRPGGSPCRAAHRVQGVALHRRRHSARRDRQSVLPRQHHLFLAPHGAQTDGCHLGARRQRVVPLRHKTNPGELVPSLLAFVSGIFALGLSGKKMDVRTAFSLLLALLFGPHAPASPPLRGIFPAVCVDLCRLCLGASSHRPQACLCLPSRVPLKRILASLPMLLLSVAVVASIARPIPRAREAIDTSKPYDLYADASQWLEANTPPGSRVFQTDWDDFPRLFYYNTHNTYLIGLDPTYMQLYDPELYDLWVLITQGKADNPSQFIAANSARSMCIPT